MKIGRFVMKWSFQGVGPEILAQDVRKNPRVVLQDQEPREAKRTFLWNLFFKNEVFEKEKNSIKMYAT